MSGVRRTDHRHGGLPFWAAVGPQSTCAPHTHRGAGGGRGVGVHWLLVVLAARGVRALSTLPSILHGSPLYGARMVSLCRRRRLLLAARAAGSGLLKHR